MDAYVYIYTHMMPYAFILDQEVLTISNPSPHRILGTLVLSLGAFLICRSIGLQLPTEYKLGELVWTQGLDPSRETSGNQLKWDYNQEWEKDADWGKRKKLQKWNPN